MNLYITARSKRGSVVRKCLDFKLSYSEVNWVDVKINRPDKKIFITLRVDLRDGGEKGLTCTQSSLQSITANSYSVGGCPWDFIPKNIIKAIGKPPIKSRTRSFENLRDLVLEGIAYHWSRNNLPNSNVATGVNINGQDYEVFVQAINTTENAMDNVDVVYNTNTFWGRSNNPGNVTGFKSLMANALQFIPLVPLNETIFYNVGYVNNNYKYESYLLFEKDSWIYIDDTLLDLKGRCKVDIEFSYTAAHEIGHNILRSYAEGGGGSADYSYKHKGSSGYSETKSVSEGGVIYPRKGEIDLMKYYNNTPYFLDFDFDRIVAAEEDVKGLLWLTKIKIKK